MLNESREGPSLVPIERVAMPTNEATDKATRKMIAQVKSTLSPRFPMEIGSDALSYQDLRFLDMRSKEDSSNGIRASLRVSDKAYQLNPRQDINLVSGMCFFGATGLRGTLLDGRSVSLTDPLQLKQVETEQVEEILEADTLHISEASTILRITSALQLLEKTQSTEEEGKITCNFHLPIPEYKLYMLELLKKGILSPKLLRESIAKIDKRAQFLAQLLQKRVPKSMELRFFSPLQSLDQLIGQRLEQTTLAECLLVLQSDPLLRTLIDESPPKKFLELPNISYGAGYIQQALKSEREGKGCLAVEIAEEHPIFKNALLQAKALGVSCEMAAFYILSDVISTRGRNGKEALFMHDPEEGASPLEELKFVIKNSKGGTCRSLR